MKSNYGFLKKLQQNEKKSGKPNTMQIAVVGGAPLSQRFGPQASFTGFGEDGALQPGNPAKMVETDQGTAMLHEGEIEIRLPDGRTTIIPANEIPQQMMQKLGQSQLKGAPETNPAVQSQGGMQGFQEGGQFGRPTPSPPPTPNVTPLNVPDVTPNQNLVGNVGDFSNLIGTNPNNLPDPGPNNLPDTMPTDVPGTVVNPNQGTATPFPPAPSQIGQLVGQAQRFSGTANANTRTPDPHDNPTPGPAPVVPIDPRPNVPHPKDNPTPTPFTPTPTPVGPVLPPNVAPVIQNPDVPDVAAPSKQIGQVTPFEPTPIPTQDIPGRPPIPNKQVGETTPFVPTPIPTQDVPGRPPIPDKQIGETTPFTPAAGKQIGDVTPYDPNKPPATGEEPSAFQQYLNQLALIAGGEGQIGKKAMIEAQQKFKAEEQAAKESQIQGQAQAGITGREALTGKAMLARDIGAAEAGLEGQLRKQQDDRAFAAAQQLPGVALQGEQLQLAKDQFVFNKDMTEQEFAFLKEKFGFSKEMTLKEFQLATEKFGLTKDKYDFDKQSSALNTMLQAGDYTGAGEMFNNLFGESIDFSKAISKENAQNFNEGFNNLNGLIASGMDFEDAIKVMEADGTLEKLGMTEGDVKTLYDNMQLQSNPMYKITQQVQDLVDAGIVPQDQADDYVDFLIWSQMNPQGVEISAGYSIKDKNGNEVGFFKDEAEAQAFMDENKDKEYDMAFMEQHYGPSTGSGTGPGGQTKPKESYEIFFDEEVPSGPNENNDWFTQSVWEDLGKPKTWDDAMKAIGPIGALWNKHDRDTTLFNDQGKLDYKEDEIKDIFGEIEGGNAFAIDKYGVKEDSAVNTLINAIKESPGPTTGKLAHDMLGGGPPLGVTKEDIEESVGKAIVYTDNTGKERKAIVKGFNEREWLGNNVQEIVLYDTETGKELLINYTYYPE